MNAFEILEVPERLVISPQELERRFDVRGKSCHPDAGGSAEEFSRIRGAYDILKTPSGRICAALESLSGSKGAPSRGGIPGLVMSSFSSVANVLEEVEDKDAQKEAGLRSWCKGVRSSRAQKNG